MTREEVIRLLKAISNAYPNQKTGDAKGTVDWWEAEFSGEEARVVYKAAKIHIDNSPYFPAPANIRRLLSRASLLIELEDERREEARRKLDAPKAPQYALPAGDKKCPLRETCILYLDLCSGPEEGACPFEGI